MRTSIFFKSAFTSDPFGSPMDGRAFSGDKYRFGFNGKENDNEIKGEGNSLDFGARIYDSRLGRWLGCDPLQYSFANKSPYIGFSNNPICRIDPNGMADFYNTSGVKVGTDGDNTNKNIYVVSDNKVAKQMAKNYVAGNCLAEAQFVNYTSVLIKLPSYEDRQEFKQSVSKVGPFQEAGGRGFSKDGKNAMILSQTGEIATPEDKQACIRLNLPDMSEENVNEYLQMSYGGDPTLEYVWHSYSDGEYYSKDVGLTWGQRLLLLILEYIPL